MIEKEILELELKEIEDEIRSIDKKIEKHEKDGLFIDGLYTALDELEIKRNNIREKIDNL